MRFAILVNSSPYQHQGALSAYHFAAAALGEGHEVYRVFFYQDGIYTATHLAEPPADEPDAGAAWSRLAKQSGVDLVCCATAGRRRRLFADELFEDTGTHPGLLAPGFRLGGLGLLIEAMVQSDRFLVFGE